MQNEWGMRPALHKSEAVLLPALERRSFSMPRFSNRFAHTKPAADSFRPVAENWPASQSTELSTYVRPRGSMAGRGVLRAAGVGTGSTLRRPLYAGRCGAGQTALRSRFR